MNPNPAIIEFKGESMTVSAWAKKLGVNRLTLSSRLHRQGWSVEMALTTPNKLSSRTHYNTSHGMSHTKAYEAWAAMKKRCLCKTQKAYSLYGGRGITICERWLDSFENFLEDMGGPLPKQQLDRIDNDGGYSKENCRWTDAKTNSRNRRTSIFLEFRGESKCLAAWAESLGVPARLIVQRHKYGWSVERILTTPIRIYGKRK